MSSLHVIQASATIDWLNQLLREKKL